MTFNKINAGVRWKKYQQHSMENLVNVLQKHLKTGLEYIGDNAKRINKIIERQALARYDSNSE